MGQDLCRSGLELVAVAKPREAVLPRLAATFVIAPVALGCNRGKMDEMVDQSLLCFGSEVSLLVVEPKDAKLAPVLGGEQRRRPGRLDLVLLAEVPLVLPDGVTGHVLANHRLVAVQAGTAAASVGSGH